MMRVVRVIIVALYIACALVFAISTCVTARGEVGGAIDGPGLCDYPSVGFSLAVNPIIGQAVAYYCRYPKEINGSYYLQGYGLYTTSGGATGGAGLLNINISAGGGGGLTGYFCLDDPHDVRSFWTRRTANDPNPPGAWKNHIDAYETCKSIDVGPPDNAGIPGINPLSPPDHSPVAPDTAPPPSDTTYQPPATAPLQPALPNPVNPEEPRN